jgi:hypothetical protein
MSRVHEEAELSPFVVYEWNAWTDFLITKVVTNALRISARLGHDTRRVMAALPADTRTFLFHLDCTRTSRFPRDRSSLVTALAGRGVKMLNVSLDDISKRRLQQVCGTIGLNTVGATRQGDPQQLVIVKTDLNSAGVRERYLSRWQRWRMGIRLSETITGREDYRVLRRCEVPPEWWNDNTLQIERYVTNCENAWYRAYVYLDRLVVSRASSEVPVKRMYHASERSNTAFVIDEDGVTSASASHPIPSTVLHAIVQLTRAARLDFGTLDLVVDESGEAFVVDLNVTPFCRDGSEEVISHLQAR